MKTPHELAELLQVHYLTVMGWIKSGFIKYVKVGRYYRIPEDEWERIKREGVDTGEIESA